MRKLISSILMIVILLANFLAPVSVGWEDKKIEVGSNKTEAQTYYGQNVKIKVDPKPDGKLGILINGNFTVPQKIESARVIYSIGKDPNNFEKNKVFDEKLDVKPSGESENVFTYSIGEQLYLYSDGNSLINVVKGEKYYAMVIISVPEESPVDAYISEPVWFTAGVPSDEYAPGGGESEINAATTADTIIAGGGTTEQAIEAALDSGTQGTKRSTESSMPQCGVGWMTGGGSIGGCIAQVIYYVFFMPSSVLFALAGTFFDNTFAYSVNDNSYRSAFVVQGWNVVRDFCNMFFIFVLLYIAFKTILDLNGAKTKEMIINVVIIGLLINFSLFATRVIIDVSNILARVFYNSNTIQITALNEDGGGVGVTDTIAKMNKTGVLPLSAALVNKVNPQSLIINAGEYGEIPDKAGMADTTKNAGEITTGTFIFVTLLASGINIVGFIVFLVVGLMFVARVIGLWLAMILAPFAFFSYTVPAMQDLDTVGFKKWWPETLKLAFLAPVFIFFLYLILQFLEVGLGVADLSNKEGMLNKLVAIVIPFAFIMVLLMQAKKIAVKMAGQAGSAVSKIGAVAGGLALGAATGRAAMLGRATLGRAAANLSQSNKFRDWAGRSKIGASALKMTSGVASSSFDARGVKVMGKGLSDTGLKNVGKAKAGGFTKIREDRVKKEEEFANKMLDTSDYGIAELQGGKISKSRSDMIMDQIEKSGGDFGHDKNGKALNRDQFRMKLAAGLDSDTARKVADQMNSARREDRAKKFENSKFMTNRIKANKIRRSPKAMEKGRQLAQTMAALAAAQKAIDEGEGKPTTNQTTPVTQTPQNTPTTNNPST